jgi:hypothetical protein
MGDIDEKNCGPVILSLITRFCSEYTNLLEGNFVRDIATETQGGARINYIFHKIFKNIIGSIDPFDNLSE